MAQIVLNYRESKNATNMLNVLLSSGIFTVNTKKTELRNTMFRAMDEVSAISQKVKKQNSTKGLKTLDELLTELK